MQIEYCPRDYIHFVYTGLETKVTVQYDIVVDYSIYYYACGYVQYRQN